MRLELDEVKGQYNDMVKKANEEVAKLERARREREVEEKKLNDINAEYARLRVKYGA
jgi:hypothetical protein